MISKTTSKDYIAIPLWRNLRIEGQRGSSFGFFGCIFVDAISRRHLLMLLAHLFKIIPPIGLISCREISLNLSADVAKVAPKVSTNIPKGPQSKPRGIKNKPQGS